MKNSGRNFKIEYHKSVRKDVSKLSKKDLEIIQKTIENKLSINPVLYGTPLRGSLQQLWKIRVGERRIIFSIKNREVYILVIGDRKEVYRLANRRGV